MAGVQLSLLEILERPTIEALFKPEAIFGCEDAEFLAKLPEDTRFEKKSSRVQPSALGTLLSAFGNGPAVEGGVVAVGIEDDGRIVGCNSLSGSRRAEIEAAGRDCCLTGKFLTKRLVCQNHQGEKDFIILIRMFEGFKLA